MKAAAIDVGTNTIKLAVGQSDADGRVELLAHLAKGARLGEGVDDSGLISPEAAERAFVAIAECVEAARSYKVDSIRLVATSAMRDAVNGDELIERVHRELGVELEVLSEEEECRLSYTAIALDPVLGSYSSGQVVADVGGGSSELTFGIGNQIIGGKSVRIGAVRLTERYLSSDPPSDNDVRGATDEAVRLLSEAVCHTEVGRVVGVGGSAVNLARMLKQVPHKSIDGIHSALITRSNMQQLIEMLAHMTIAERKNLTGLVPARADIILGGAIILDSVMAVTGATELVVSIMGLRQGVLYEMLAGTVDSR